MRTGAVRVGCHHYRIGSTVLIAAVKVSPDRLGQVFKARRTAIRLEATIKSIRHDFQPPVHSHVPAPQLSQRFFEACENFVDQRLRKIGLGSEPLQHQPSVQRHEIKAPVHCIRYTETAKEIRLPRLRYKRGMEPAGECLAGCGALQVLQHAGDVPACKRSQATLAPPRAGRAKDISGCVSPL